MTPNISARLKELIRYDQLGEAIDYAIDANDDMTDEWYNRVIHLSQRNRHNSALYNKGIINHDNYKITKNKICNDFLVLIDELHQQATKAESQLISSPEIRLLGAAQQDRFRKIIADLVLTDKEIIIVTKGIDDNNKVISASNNSADIRQLRDQNTALKERLSRLEQQYELLKNEYNALKREKEHMQVLTKIFAKKDGEFDEMAKKNRFLEFELEQSERMRRQAEDAIVELKANVSDAKVEKKEAFQLLKNLENSAVNNKEILDNANEALQRKQEETTAVQKKNQYLLFVVIALSIACIALLIAFVA